MWKKDIVADKQKGFLRGIQGCIDHIAKIQFLLAYTNGNKKLIYLATLHCKDAFGSVTHDDLRNNSQQEGFKRKFN
jgi:hypothetical protein